MRKLKLDVDSLSVNTFATADARSSGPRRALADHDARWTEGLSFCLLECGTETISIDGACTSN